MFYTYLNILEYIVIQVATDMPNMRHPTLSFIGFWCNQKNKMALKQLARREKVTVSAYLSKLVTANLKLKSKVLVGLAGSSSAQAEVSVDVASKFLTVIVCCIQSVLVHPLPVKLPFIC